MDPGTVIDNNGLEVAQNTNLPLFFCAANNTACTTLVPVVGQTISGSPDGLTYTFARTQLPTLFYEDVSPEDRYRAMERLRPQPIAISTTPLSLTEERYGSVPRWYIECLYDNSIRIARQRAMVKTLPCKVITMECGHTPFYSQPEELVDHLGAIAAS